MIIVSKDKTMIVNMDNILTINIFDDGEYARKETRHCVLAYYGCGSNDFVSLGSYATEERCKEILQEIRNEYGKYFYRQGGPAILRGSVDVPGEIWNVPKCYDMPEE